MNKFTVGDMVRVVAGRKAFIGRNGKVEAADNSSNGRTIYTIKDSSGARNAFWSNELELAAPSLCWAQLDSKGRENKVQMKKSTTKIKWWSLVEESEGELIVEDSNCTKDEMMKDVKECSESYMSENDDLNSATLILTYFDSKINLDRINVTKEEVSLTFEQLV